MRFCNLSREAVTPNSRTALNAERVMGSRLTARGHGPWRRRRKAAAPFLRNCDRPQGTTRANVRTTASSLADRVGHKPGEGINAFNSKTVVGTQKQLKSADIARAE